MIQKATETPNDPSNDTQDRPSDLSEKEAPKKIEVGKLFDAIYAGYGPNSNETAKKNANETITAFLAQTARNHAATSEDYNVIIHV